MVQKRMKLLYIFSAYSLKGPYHQQWISVLKQRKELEIAIVFINNDSKISSYYKDDILFIPFNFKNGKNLAFNYLNNNLELRKIIKEVDNFQPTVLHLHGSYNTYLSRIPLYSKTSFKFIFNLWGSDYNISFFNSKKHIRLMTALFEKADKVLTLWYSLENKVRENSPQYAKKLKTIPWGIEKAALRPSNLKIKNELQNIYKINTRDYVLLSIKGIIPNSNQDIILKAISLLNPNIPVKLIIHSPTKNEAYYKKLLKFVAQNNLENKVIFSSSYLSKEQFRALYSIANLSIIISSQDQFTRSLLEGIIEESNLIVSNILPFQLLNKKFDLNLDTVNPKDSIGLAKKIERLYAHKNDFEVKQKRLKILKENFIFENQFDKILQLYTKTSSLE